MLLSGSAKEIVRLLYVSFSQQSLIRIRDSSTSCPNYHREVCIGYNHPHWLSFYLLTMRESIIANTEVTEIKSQNRNEQSKTKEYASLKTLPCMHNLSHGSPVWLCFSGFSLVQPEDRHSKAEFITELQPCSIN